MNLKEHRLFIINLIIATIIFLFIGIAFNIHDIILYGSILGLIAIFNITSYIQK